MEIRKKYSDLPDNIQKILANGNVFFTKEYECYARATGSSIWYIYDQQYILPVNVTEKIKIRRALYISEPLAIEGALSNRTLANFLNGVAVVLRKERVAWVSTSAAALFDAYPDESQRIPFGSHIIDLSLSEDELLMKMHSKHRNSVRRAERKGVTVFFGGKELIPDYLKIDADTWQRSDRKSYGGKFFEKIIDNLEDKAVFYVAYREGVPQAGACYFVNHKMCYYMYGASITNPEPGAANLLQWVAIKNMKAAGVEKFSFVGCRINEDEDSKYHGIQRFKERFGGELYQGYMFKSILSPTKYHLFRAMYKLKKGTVSSGAIEQEKHKWPELQKTVVEDKKCEKNRDSNIS